MSKKHKIKKQSYFPWWDKKHPLKNTKMNIKKEKYSYKSGMQYALSISNESIDNEYKKEM